MYGKFPEYHTSADNLKFIDKDKLNLTLKRYLEIIYIIENDNAYLNLNPKCEPQLGRRGLYTNLGAQKSKEVIHSAIFWILNYSDGNNSLMDIAVKSKIDFNSNEMYVFIYQVGMGNAICQINRINQTTSKTCWESKRIF